MIRNYYYYYYIIIMMIIIMIFAIMNCEVCDFESQPLD